MIQVIKVMDVSPARRKLSWIYELLWHKKNLTQFRALLTSSISGWCLSVPKKTRYREEKAAGSQNKGLIPLVPVRNWGVPKHTRSHNQFCCSRACLATVLLVSWLISFGDKAGSRRLFSVQVCCGWEFKKLGPNYLNLKYKNPIYI